MTDVALIAVVLGVVAAGRTVLAPLPITAPMLYLVFGVLIGPDVLAWFDLELESETVAVLAEFTLALLLFADASRIDVRRLRRSIAVPVRLLAVGLPLTVALGTAVTAMLLADLSWAEAALVAAILAPTDAALGEAVVTDDAVPIRVRQALNVESGLNDGLVVPAVAIFLSVATGADLESPGRLATEALEEIAIGLAFGVGVAFILAKLTEAAMQRAWTDRDGYRLLMAAGAVTAFAGASAAEGNGFIAAFVAGILVRAFIGEPVDEQTELAEDVAQVGAAATFVVFGALLVVPAVEEITVAIAVCAVSTLTLGRMLPVWVALLGTHLRLPTVAFIGWFGPRGLASMVFGLLVLQDESLAAREELFSVIVVVILASVVLHGASAAPLARRYGAWFAEHGRADMQEMVDVENPMARNERR